MSVLEEISAYNRNDYQRDNFDSFLKKVSFKYDIPSIHVTGTNGKGSTCNYINNIYSCSFFYKFHGFFRVSFRNSFRT